MGTRPQHAKPSRHVANAISGGDRRIVPITFVRWSDSPNPAQGVIGQRVHALRRRVFASSFNEGAAGSCDQQQRQRKPLQHTAFLLRLLRDGGLPHDLVGPSGTGPPPHCALVVRVDRRVHVDPRTSGALWRGSRSGPKRLPELSGIRPQFAPANQRRCRDASDALSCTPAEYVLDHGSGIRNETDNLGPNWAQLVQCAIT